jgi:hypothetical protein
MLRVIFYHVGKGDLSLVLLPNGEALMIDCYKADELAQDAMTSDDNIFERVKGMILRFRERVAAGNKALGESVRKEKEKQKKIPIAALFITHADRDHITVRKKLREEFDIELLVDSGRDYDSATDCMKDYLQFRKFMQGINRYRAIRRAAFDIWPGCGAKVDVLCPNRDVDESEDNNNQCMVIRIEYQKWSFLFTGDSPYEDWADEKTGILKLHGSKVASNILNASHHGSRTFFTPSGQRGPNQPEYKKEDFDRRGIRAIAPIHSFITCSDDEEADFPHPIAMEVYGEETNPSLPGRGAAHVVLSRDSKHMHYVVSDDGRLYSRTSYSRNNHVPPEEVEGKTYSLRGSVSGGNGYLTRDGIWVTRTPLSQEPNLRFEVQAKGPWPRELEFDWWVLNIGQGRDVNHREYYTMESTDRKKLSKWERPLVYEGAHLMQCHATAEDGKIWANWCVLVCHETSLPYARQWLELYPTCIDPQFINR